MCIRDRYMGINEETTKRQKNPKIALMYRKFGNFTTAQLPGKPADKDTWNDDEEIVEQVKSEDAPKLTYNYAENVGVDIKFKQKTIVQNSLEARILPMMVSIKSKDVPHIGASRPNVDLVCVIDHSGSMSGDKINLLKKSFAMVLDILKDNDRLSIIIFNDKALRILPFVRMSDEGKARALERINQVIASGGTDITLGMQYALTALEMRRYKNKVASIFLLSDGLDNAAERGCRQLFENSDNAGAFTISTFGYGNDHDSAMMSNISKLKTGKFYYIEKIDTVADCFADSLSALQTVIGQNLLLSVRVLPSPLLPGVEIVKAFGAAHIVSFNQVTQEYDIKLQYLTGGVSKNYVFELSIPPSDKVLSSNDNIATISLGRLEFTEMGGGQYKSEANGQLRVLNKTEEAKEMEEEDIEVMTNYYRVLGAQVISDAQAAAAEKKHDEAEKLLLTFLESVDSEKWKNSPVVQIVLKDVTACVQMVKYDNYQVRGKHYMTCRMRGHMEEDSQPMYDAGVYANREQREQVEAVIAKKELNQIPDSKGGKQADGF
eukprot:TRINITY_DN13496_c0_g1_i12.p1 TRINITY_DN13496_c0_g1~~TRINITY_DN13496_c0_g1_i12.p1  ORF type:complete len:576 (+),score=80.06 TRINITY_DN13496_c0_g1_i12:90-1730(+)